MLDKFACDHVRIGGVLRISHVTSIGEFWPAANPGCWLCGRGQVPPMSVFSFSWPLAVAVQVDIAALTTCQVAFMLASFTIAPWIAVCCPHAQMLSNFFMMPNTTCVVIATCTVSSYTM